MQVLGFQIHDFFCLEMFSQNLTPVTMILIGSYSEPYLMSGVFGFCVSVLSGTGQSKRGSRGPFCKGL